MNGQPTPLDQLLAFADCGGESQHRKVSTLAETIQAELDALKKDQQNAWEFYAECANTPLMANVIRQRDTAQSTITRLTAENAAKDEALKYLPAQMRGNADALDHWLKYNVNPVGISLYALADWLRTTSAAPTACREALKGEQS